MTWGYLATFLALLLALPLAGCGGSEGTAPLGAPVPQQHSGWAVSVQPDGGYGMIIHTADSGQTWVRQGSPAQVPAVGLQDVCAVDELNAWAVGDASDGYATILRTRDGGATWSRQGDPGTVPDCSVTGLRAVDSRTAWAAGTQGVILETTDGGANWLRVDQGQVPGAGLLQSVWGVDGNVAWVSGADQSPGGGGVIIMKTTNGGVTWSRQGSAEQIGDEACIIELGAVDAANAWGVGAPKASGGQTPFLQTSDGGQTWTNMAPPSTGYFHGNGLCVVDARTVWVAFDYGIYLTRDGGLTWSYFTPPGPYGAFSPFMGVSAVDGRTAWVVNMGMSTGPCYVVQHTEDGGATWTQQATPVVAGGLRRISMVGARR